MNPRLLIFITLFTVTISGIGVDLYVPSLPAIADAFRVPGAYAKLTVSTYFIGFAIGQLCFGVLSDVLGRKHTLSTGIFLFIIASLIAPFSPNITTLWILRGVQGIGAAACSAISKTLFADTLKGKKLVIAFSYLSLAWGVGPIVAPVIGGYLQFYFNWQANFYFYAIYSGALLLTVLFFLKETHHQRTLFKPKLLSKKFKTIMSHKAFVGGIIALGTSYAMIVVFNVVGPFLIQTVLGYNAAVYGHVALFIGGAYFLGTIMNRILLAHMNTKMIVRLGLLTTLIASLTFLFITYEFRMNLYNLTIPFFMIILGTGITFPNVMSKCMMLFPQSRGIASAIMGVAFSLITAAASASVGFLKGSTPIPIAWAMTIFVVLILGLYWFMITGKDEDESSQPI